MVELGKNIPLQGLFFHSEYEANRQNSRRIKKGDFVIIETEFSQDKGSFRYLVSFCAENAPLFMRAFPNENGKIQTLGPIEKIEIIGSSVEHIAKLLILISSLCGLSLQFLKDIPSGRVYELV